VAEDGQLQWEARVGRLAAAAAFVSAALLVAYVIVRQAVALKSRPDNTREFLAAIDDQSAAYVASAVLQALSVVALSAVLWYLFNATRNRRPELPPWAVYIVLLAPFLLAAANVISSLDELDIADRFLGSGPRTEDRADDLLGDRAALGVALGSAGGLGVALSLVLININAMRAGLVSRFLGVVGVILGALIVLPIVPPFILQAFWLVAVGLIFLGRWPGGRGPAWETGEAVPWPTAAERAQERSEALAPAGADDAPEEADVPRPASRKRKRKKRR
jgi:hypothetical protein